MTPTDAVIWVGGIATVICAVYTVLGYYRPTGATMSANAADPPVAARRHPWVPIICVGLVWLAVGADYFTRPPIAEATIFSYGLAPSGVPDTDNFSSIVQLRDWTAYKNEKAILIVHTLYGDVDRMTDTFLAKSSLYTITGPTLGLLAVNRKTMRFTPNQTNMVEYDFAVVPSVVELDQIKKLDDITTVGGKLLASAMQGIPVIMPPTATPTAPLPAAPATTH